MLLLSWNVAGWTTTSRQIRTHYGSLHSFLQRSGADVLCLQETKVSLEKIRADPTAAGVSDGGAAGGVLGWESFWCVSSRQHRGMNGVAAFAREGLVHSCDAKPFGDDVLDEEGRCLVCEFQGVVVINVYVPNARGGERHDFKMRFVAALHQLTVRLRAKHRKPLILAGDLNLTYRADDAVWWFRELPLTALQELYEHHQQQQQQQGIAIAVDKTTDIDGTSNRQSTTPTPTTTLPLSLLSMHQLSLFVYAVERLFLRRCWSCSSSAPHCSLMVRK